MSEWLNSYAIMSRLADRATVGSMSYEVWRRDDYGNDFLVAANLSQSEAQKLVDDLTARGHKQMYWMVEAKAPPHRKEIDFQKGDADQ